MGPAYLYRKKHRPARIEMSLRSTATDANAGGRTRSTQLPAQRFIPVGIGARCYYCEKGWLLMWADALSPSTPGSKPSQGIKERKNASASHPKNANISGRGFATDMQAITDGKEYGVQSISKPY